MDSNKDITRGAEAQEEIAKGIYWAADAVLPTLGPIGLAAAIEFPGLDALESDDGVTILKNLRHKDRLANIGVQRLRKAAVRTSTEGGDGTATTTALGRALVKAARDEVGSDLSKVRAVRERLAAGLSDVLAQLSELKEPVTGTDVERIAAISSLDPEVAKMIAEIVGELGPAGVIEVEKGSSLGVAKEVTKGARFDKGMASHLFTNDHEAERCVLERPWICLIDRKVSVGKQLEGIMNALPKDAKSILFISDDMDGTALASLIQASKTVTIVDPQGKHATGTYDVACARNPFTATPGKDFLRDIAALTGATVITEEAGMKLSECGTAQLGRAEKVILTKDRTTIFAAGDLQSRRDRAASIRAEIEASTSDYQRLMLRDRLARIDGGIGIIRVGAYTDTDYAAKKLKYDNAIRAAQSALQEGKLPGGGAALLKVRPSEPMFQKALSFPFRQMCDNAGIEWHRFESLASDKASWTGVDFVGKAVVDMRDAGIIESFKVARLALEGAANLAASVISYGTAITHSDDGKEDKALQR